MVQKQDDVEMVSDEEFRKIVETILREDRELLEKLAKI